MKLKLNNALFALLLFLLIQLSIFEVHYLIYFFTILLFYSKVSKQVINVVTFLALIFCITIFSSFFYKHTTYDWIKDFTYFSKPLLAILSGYFIAKKIKNIKSICKTIIYVSLFFAIIHILKVVFIIDFSTATISDIRKVGGISNEIEVFSIVLLILSNKYENLKVITRNYFKKIALAIFILSFILYFSRTMLVTLIIFLLASYGYLKITTKGIKYGLIVLASFGLFYVYLYNSEIKRDTPGVESFLYKMKIAPAEIFSLVDKKRMNDHAYLWDHWRAYEATVAIEQINTIPSFLFGKGLGSLVDLGIGVYLGGEKMRFIPILHNGYVHIYFKSGVVGLFLYLLLLFSLYLFSYSKSKDNQKKIVSNLIGGLAVHFLFTSLIVTGMYNIMELYVFILGILFYFKSAKSIKLEKT